MEALRTPDHRFARLAAYPYHVRSIELGERGGPRMAYVSVGAHEHRAVLLLHGGPTWSYLWRRVIPSLAEAGMRVVAPDLVGFGMSDKPRRVRDVAAARQIGWLGELCERLALEKAVLVFHGASAWIGLRLLAQARGRFSSAVGVGPVLDADSAEVKAALGQLGEEPEPAAAAAAVAAGCAAPLADAARAAYDAPFSDEEHAAGLRALPGYLPEADDWAAELGDATVGLPVLAATGAADRLTGPADWLERLPGGGAAGDGTGAARERFVIAGAGHFAPEDRGPELALAILAFVARH